MREVPGAGGQPAVLHAGPRAAENPLNARRYILVVDDNPEDGIMLRMALQRNRVLNEVVSAKDGEEALQMLVGEHGPLVLRRGMPALAILDLRMPRLDGIQLLERLRADPRGAVVPVVMMSNADRPEDIARAYRAGANSFVRKPSDFDGYVKALGEVADYWLRLNQPPLEPPR